MFQSVNSKVDFPELENEILNWWEENNIPDKYMSKNENSDKRYSFIDGPITANNPMGVHHAWGRSYKDLFARFRTMQGYKQRYQNGFDGQGLWIEVEVEKELGFQSKTDIEKFGVGKFVTKCKERVQKFADIITSQSIRLAQWNHWDNSYHTMSDENNYTIWHFLKTCQERDLIYQGTDVMPWCPRCSTGLSEHEIVTEGYLETVHPGLFVKFPILDSGSKRTPNESVLIWTTTPWTLSSNCAAAVNEDMDYVKVQQDGEFYYLAKSRLKILKGEHEIVSEMKGKDLVGLRYQGPFDELPVQKGREHRVVAWDEVSEGEGTGIVHIAPGAGKEDFALGKKEGIEPIAPLNDLGDFIEGFDWLTGLNVYDVNDKIYESLKSKNVFYRVEKYTHRYPHCWRCGSELVFRLVNEWFIKMDPLRESLARVTQNINWVPEFGMKRELDWLKNMDDWMISKKRYYGLALPIWEFEDGSFYVVGSKEELKKLAVEGWEEFEGNSPHRPWIDKVKIKHPKSGLIGKRIIDVGNPWLDAGIVSFSTLKYGSDREYWNEWFPADWISESFPGQYRNWFYSLLTMSTVLEDSEPCKNIFSYALMRDQHGEEMHKSKGNAIWFEDAADKMGVDAMRWQFASQNPASNLNFGFETADEVRRQFLIPFWNVYSFFVTYANIDQFDPDAKFPELAERSELDRWIISELNSLIAYVTNGLENFEPEKITREVESFMEFLSNWYVRRSRRRFWKTGLLNVNEKADSDKLSAYSTLYEVLVTLSKLLAPVIPFVTENIYQNLVSKTKYGRQSVHLEDYPEFDSNAVDDELVSRIRLAMKISSLGRSARSKANIKVRQPLQNLYVKTRDQNEIAMLNLIQDQIIDELNIKSIVPIDDAAEIIKFKIQPNLPVLGPKFGNQIAQIRKELDQIDPELIRSDILQGKSVSIAGNDLTVEDFLVVSEELEGFSSSLEGPYAVGVSVDISEDLIHEGIARELVHKIQNMRRSADFEISDRIEIWINTNSEMNSIIEKHRDYINSETLSDSMTMSEVLSDLYIESQDFDGIVVEIGVRKV